jgi:serine/threonine protein kinase
VSEPAALIGGRYRMVRLVGRGGMGAVWEAWDERLERRVALKLLHRPSGVSSKEADLANVRAMREARLNARLDHPNAVRVYDVTEHEGQPCLIMQFIPSITLSAVMAEVGPLLLDEAAQVGAQVASALAAAHAVGIVHRDVKPGNILIAEDGTALISDFGIARALGDATLTTSGMVHGTPAYLAPEVARGGESNFASDVFSLGSTLYGAIEGVPPFGADQNSIALLHRVAAGEFALPKRCGALTPLIMDMLSVVPDARPSMREVVDRLKEHTGPSGSNAIGKALTMSGPGESRGPSAAVHSRVPSLSNTGPPADTPESPGLTLSKTAPGSEASPPTSSRPDSLPESRPGSQDQRPAEPRRNRAVTVALVLVAVLGIGTLLAGVFMDDRRVADPPAGACSDQATVVAPSTTSPSPAARSRAPSASSTRRDPSLTATPRTSARPPSLVPTATTAPTVRGTATAAELRRAITSYYALMPRNTDAAWPRMTASYQTNHAGGRAAYQRFWGAIDRISLADVTGTPPNSAQATITYYFKDGRVVRERTAYGLVNEGGRLKINSSTVLSSITV